MNNNNENDINEKIRELTNKYYSENKKNIFFKNKQKMDCAANISISIGINEFINNSIYIIPNTNNLFLDYTIFKQFANPDNYNIIIEHILSLIETIIRNFNIFSVHINLDTFTISAAERYKNIITMFLNKCIINNSGYSLKLDKMHIYNTPNSFQTISTILMPLIDNEIKTKIILYDKKKLK
jgi:hypothetical protein